LKCWTGKSALSCVGSQCVRKRKSRQSKKNRKKRKMENSNLEDNAIYGTKNHRSRAAGLKIKEGMV